jgi:transmembrane sensor
MPLTRFAFLFRKFHQKTATPEEVAEFQRLTAMDEHAAELQQLLEEAWAEPDATAFAEQGSGPVFTAAESEEMLRQVFRGGEESSAAKVVAMDPGRTAPVSSIDGGAMAASGRLRWWRPVAAAVVLLGLGLGVWWWARSGAGAVVAVAVTRPQLPAPVPGGNKAVLILANGSTVLLDSTKNGLLATQGATNVVKVAGGQLAYARGGASAGSVPGGEGASAGGGKGTTAGAAVLYNTIRTPRGGQYEVTLPDGSRVWLNAATSLRFPTVFAGADRTVELSGEAYFEVARVKDQPFKVKVGVMTVDVLGTHFDVMAYDDEESFMTTLLSGAVRVSGGDISKVLKPGEEAVVGWNGQGTTVAEVDTDQAVAWKNGLFQFESAGLKEVMRQVARWYDVDVRYEGTVERHFSGFIARSASLADVLHQLERAGKTSFTLEGRTVTVKPK